MPSTTSEPLRPPWKRVEYELFYSDRLPPFRFRENEEEAARLAYTEKVRCQRFFEEKLGHEPLRISLRKVTTSFEELLAT